MFVLLLFFYFFYFDHKNINSPKNYLYFQSMYTHNSFYFLHFLLPIATAAGCYNATWCSFHFQLHCFQCSIFYYYYFWLYNISARFVHNFIFVIASQATNVNTHLYLHLHKLHYLVIRMGSVLFVEKEKK